MLAGDRVALRGVALRVVTVRVTRTVTETALRAKLAYALLEEATSNGAYGTVRGHRLVDARCRRRRRDSGVPTRRLYMPISTVASLSTGAILEVSANNTLRPIVGHFLAPPPPSRR